MSLPIARQPELGDLTFGLALVVLLLENLLPERHHFGVLEFDFNVESAGLLLPAMEHERAQVLQLVRKLPQVDFGLACALLWSPSQCVCERGWR